MKKLSGAHEDDKWVNPLMLIKIGPPKAVPQSWGNLSSESIVGKIFERGMLIRMLPTTLLQIVLR